MKAGKFTFEGPDGFPRWVGDPNELAQKIDKSIKNLRRQGYAVKKTTAPDGSTTITIKINEEKKPCQKSP